MKNIIDTERLSLREFCLDDAAFILELLNTTGWKRFIGDRGIKTTEAAKGYLLNGPLKSYETHGFGLWLVALKETGKAIGMCGLLKREQLDQPDIGFAFLPAHTGKGYALEAAKASLVYAGKQLGISTVLAITKVDNILSISLLKKLGLHFDKIIQLPSNEEELFLFSGPTAVHASAVRRFNGKQSDARLSI